MSRIEKAWFEKRWWVWCLAPLTLLFFLVSHTRRLLFKFGFKTSTKPNVPVIVVGNISVGGNGKTPVVIALCHYLQKQGFSPGIVSRGYGGDCATFPHIVTDFDSSHVVGDEPFLMRQRLKVPVVIDPIRARGAEMLTQGAAAPKCDVIVCDDGLQHYALARDIELVVVDGTRGHGNGYLLPMGPLREGEWRLNTVDAVIVNGGVAKGAEVPLVLEPSALVNVRNPEKTVPLSDVSKPVLAFAGIGHPERFFTTLANQHVLISQALSFPDHHYFDKNDIPEYEGMVVMTEKDAVKCREIAKENWWYLPVEGKLPAEFLNQISNKLRQIKS